MLKGLARSLYAIFFSFVVAGIIVKILKGVERWRKSGRSETKLK